MARLAVAQLIADALAHPTTGIAAEIASVPRPSGQPLPATPQIVDETRFGPVARNMTPGSWEVAFPVLAVTVERVLYDAVTTGPLRRFDATVLVRYVIDNADTVTAQRDLHVVQRALLRVLSRFVRQSPEQDGIQLGGITAYEESGLFAPNDDGIVTLGLQFTLSRCRDTAA